MKVKFKGFDGEDLTVRIVKDRGRKHHHLEVYCNDKKLWYAHLMKDAISLWDGGFHENSQEPSEGEDNIYLKLGGSNELSRC